MEITTGLTKRIVIFAGLDDIVGDSVHADLYFDSYELNDELQDKVVDDVGDSSCDLQELFNTVMSFSMRKSRS